jgi:hypothetical protein
VSVRHADDEHVPPDHIQLPVAATVRLAEHTLNTIKKAHQKHSSIGKVQDR